MPGEKKLAGQGRGMPCNTRPWNKIAMMACYEAQYRDHVYIS